MRGSGGGLQGDLVSESFELGDEPSGLAFGVAAGEVVAAEVVVDLAGGEHVPAGADDRVLDGADGAAVPELGLLATVEGLEVAAVGADRGERRVLERVVEPLAPFTGPAGATLAGGLVVAGTLPGPGRQVAGRREHAHIEADLGDDVFGGAPLDARAGTQQLNRRGERGELLLDRVGDALYLLLEEVDVREDGVDQQRVQRL